MVRLQRIDPDKDRDGVQFKHPSGYSIRVRPSDNPIVRDRIRTEVGAYKARLASDQLTREQYAEIEARVFAEEVLLGWEGIDEAPEYSKAKALEFMTDPRLRWFQDFVRACAASDLAFVQALEEAVSGNSQAGSAGS